MAIGALAILEGPRPHTEAFVRLMSERIQRIPKCTQVLRVHDFDLAAPEWVHDDTFDLRHHVRRTAVARPGDERALFDAVAEIMERRLERSRPLWEAWIVDGLPNGRWALLVKIHHCMTDGVSANSVLAALCDEDPVAALATEPTEDRPPANRPTATRISMNPFDWWNEGRRLSRAAVRTTARTAQLAARVAWPIGQSVTTPLSDLRRYAAVRVAIDDVRSVCDRFDVAVDDVALAAITDGVRSAVLHRGDSIEPDALRTPVAVSLRASDELHLPDNRFSLMLPLLPVELSDPLQRLQAVHERITSTKSRAQQSAGYLVVSVGNLLPFAVTACAVKLFARLPRHGVITVATNVPGPRQPMAIMERAVLSLMPVPPIAIHLRIGIAVTTYADELAFGIIGDVDAPIDVDALADGIADGVERLAALASACKSSRRHGPLLLLSS